jgi:hypothetical protein
MNIHDQEKTPSQFHRRHRTLLYPSRSRHEMQCFYAARLGRGHPRDAIKINLCLSNELFTRTHFDDHPLADRLIFIDDKARLQIARMLTVREFRQQEAYWHISVTCHVP